MSTILATGGLGFIGSHTTVLLLERGFDVLVIDSLVNSKLGTLNKIKQILNNLKVRKKGNIFFRKGDIRDKEFLENLFNLTGNYKDLFKRISEISLSKSSKKEIQNIIKISKMINFHKNDQIFLDFTEFNKKNYHDGIKFTFYAKDVRGEIASGGRYKIKNKLNEESSVGFTCFMDTK